MAWNLPRSPDSLSKVVGCFSSVAGRPTLTPGKEDVEEGSPIPPPQRRRLVEPERRDSTISAVSSVGSIAHLDDPPPPSSPHQLDEYSIPDIENSHEDIEAIFDLVPFPIEWIIDFTDVPAFNQDNAFYGSFRSLTSIRLVKTMALYIVHAVAQENSHDQASKDLFMIASRSYVALFSQVENSWDKIRFPGFYAKALSQCLYLSLLFSFPNDQRTLTRPEFLQNLVDTICLSVSGLLGPRPQKELWNSVGKRLLPRLKRWKLKHQRLNWPLPPLSDSLPYISKVKSPRDEEATGPGDEERHGKLLCYLNHSRFVQTYLMATRKNEDETTRERAYEFDKLVATRSVRKPGLLPSHDFWEGSSSSESSKFGDSKLRTLGEKRPLGLRRTTPVGSTVTKQKQDSSTGMEKMSNTQLSKHLHQIHSQKPRVKGAANGKCPFQRKDSKTLGPHSSPYPWLVSKVRLSHHDRDLFSGFKYETQQEQAHQCCGSLQSSSPLLRAEEFYQSPHIEVERKATAESLRKKSLALKIRRESITERTASRGRRESVEGKSVFLTEFDSMLKSPFLDISEKTAKERVEEMEKTGELSLLNRNDIDDERSDYFYLNAALRPPRGSNFHQRRRLLDNVHSCLRDNSGSFAKQVGVSQRRVKRGWNRASSELQEIARTRATALASSKSIKETSAYIMFKREQDEKDVADQLQKVQTNLKNQRHW